MNLDEYIASGIVEAYLLGEVSEEQRKEVERNLILYPELKDELSRQEKTLEALMDQLAIAPQPSVREGIFSQIGAPKQGKIISLQTVNWKYAAAASIAFALIASYLAFSYRSRWQETTLALENLISQNEQIAEDFNTVNQRLEKIQDDFSILGDASYMKVVMTGTSRAPESMASVYWNSSTNEVYLSVQQLAGLPRDRQFQLWAIVDGKPVDAGVFDPGFEGLLRMKSVTGASAFAVTIEPQGGSLAPTIEDMQVSGPVSV